MTGHHTVLLALTLWLTCAVRAGSDVAVAWNDERTQRGVVRGMSALSPWSFETEPIEVGRDVVLRHARGVLYALSRAEGSIAAIDVDSWTVTRTYLLDPALRLEDIALVSDEVVHVTAGAATHLLRLDLASGEATGAADLSVFADPDGVPDLGLMAVVDGRLFVQVRRLESGLIPVPPALLAVVDAVTGELIDVDPTTPGTQAIELAGTAPRMKMQALPASGRLIVSATGIFQDEGGLESIDLGTLRSQGVFIRELGPGTAADLGAFVMTRDRSGYLVVSTDLLTSSHLKGFSIGGGVYPPEDLETNVDYFVPALVHDPGSDALFLPVRADGGHQRAHGVHVFDAGTAARLTAEAIPTDAPPTDLELLCEAPRLCSPVGGRFLRADSNADGLADLSDSLHTIAYLLLGGKVPPCRSGADANDDGRLNLADPIFLLGHLYRGSPPPAPPFPDCGKDLTADDLDCRDHDPCSRAPAASPR
jgi:hypothetical protein